jgi:hypothetical protein
MAAGMRSSTVCPGAERSGLYTWYGAHAQWSITLSRETPVRPMVLVLPRTCVAGMHGLGLRSEIDLSWWMVVGWRAAVAGRATRLAQQQSDLAKGG